MNNPYSLFAERPHSRIVYPGLCALLIVLAWNAPARAQEMDAVARIGIIGLDTSHSPAFAELINAPDAGPEYAGYRVVAAYPKGSEDIESSVSKIPEYTDAVRALGVEIVDSIEDLLERVDAVMLETNDGRPHLAQARLVIEAGKPLFIDKPVAGSLADAIAIYRLAEEHGVPVFSSSSLRYTSKALAVRDGSIGEVVGADTYSPATLEPHHPDFFWYGIHGVELLYTVMKTGCKSVRRVHTVDTDIVVGLWADGRVGTVRGTRTGLHSYGGTAFGRQANQEIGPYEGYGGLVAAIVEFFRTGVSPVSVEETIEIYTFMEAADESKRHGGAEIRLADVYAAAAVQSH